MRILFLCDHAFDLGLDDMQKPPTWVIVVAGLVILMVIAYCLGRRNSRPSYSEPARSSKPKTWVPDGDLTTADDAGIRARFGGKKVVLVISYEGGSPIGLDSTKPIEQLLENSGARVVQATGDIVRSGFLRSVPMKYASLGLDYVIVITVTQHFTTEVEGDYAAYFEYSSEISVWARPRKQFDLWYKWTSCRFESDALVCTIWCLKRAAIHPVSSPLD